MGRRSPRVRNPLVLTLIALFLPARDAVGPLRTGAPPGDPSPIADHHAHIRSAAATRVLLQIQKIVGQRVVGEDARPTGARELVAALDSAGAKKAAVLSVAYLFGFPGLELPDERWQVEAENDYVAREVATHPDRLVGFCSVNPLAAYALEEIERCRSIGLTGLKLHFANSGVSLREPEHIARLKDVFRAADRLGMPLVVHLRTRDEAYGREDALVFLRELLPEAPHVPVQVAHLAGWGGFDAATDSAFQAFVDTLRVNATAFRGRLVFDLAATVIPPERARGDTALLRRIGQMNRRIAERIRDVGVGYVVFGTDWDVVPVKAYAEVVRRRLPLDPNELQRLLSNRAPYMK